jgi:hypothetical protein
LNIFPKGWRSKLKPLEFEHSSNIFAVAGYVSPKIFNVPVAKSIDGETTEKVISDKGPNANRP